MTLLIAGSRSITDAGIVHPIIDSILDQQGVERKDIKEVVSGKAPGVDFLGELWARNNSIPVVPFYAQWAIGKKAGHIRNRDMALYLASHSPSFAIIIWDGSSPGTANMISQLVKNEIPYRVEELK